MKEVRGKNKLKIAMVTDSFHPLVGGSETAIKNLSLGFLKMGHEVKIFGLFEGVQSPDSRLDVIYVPETISGINLGAIGRFINLNKEIKKYKPDVVNAHFMLMSGWAGVKAARSNKIASVVTVRGKGVFYKASNLKEAILYYLYRKMSRKADIMIATSAEMAEIVNKRWGKSPTPLSNGVNIEHFRPDIKTDLRRKFGLENKKIILCVRRLVPKNGIEYMVRAMPKILEKEQRAFLVLVAPKERWYEFLKKLSEELGFGDKVMFPGEVDHSVLPEYFAMADVVVQPSIAEARSLSCLEAMASRSAVIATNTGGLGELIHHGENGYLVPAFEESTYHVGEVKEEGINNLAEAVIEVLFNDKLRNEIKAGARKTAEENSWPNICSKTLDIYKEAIGINKKNED